MDRNFYVSAVLLIFSVLPLRATAAPAPCTATAGEFTDRITISWEPVDGTGRYGVYRAYMEKGDFEKIATVSGTSYEDSSAEPGLQYWYRVESDEDVERVASGTPSVGYRKAARPAGIDIERAIRLKTRPAPLHENAEEKLRDDQYRALTQKYRKHPAELNIIHHVVRSYVKKGAIVALDGFGAYDLDYENREITLYQKNYAFMVLFKSSRLFRMFVEAAMNGLIDMQRRPLVDILVDNMTAFCVYREERKITDAGGRTRHVPCYDAVGISTELYKDYREWKNSTMIFATGNKDLENRVTQFRERSGE